MMRVDMSGYRRVNFYELCRLCTSSEGDKTHIFNEEGRKRQLLTKIEMCLQLQVSEEDSLPKIICNLCLDKLEGFCDFRNSCIKAEGMLESYASALRFNTDFKREGKVYVKEVSLVGVDKGVVSEESLEEEEGVSRVEVGSTGLPTATQEIHVQLESCSPVKVVSCSPGSKTTATLSSIPVPVPVPVTIDSLSSLVQAAAIQIVSHPASTDSLHDDRLHHFKMQIHADETSGGEQSYTFQTPVPASPKIIQTHHALPSKTVKSTSTQMDEDLQEVEEVVESDPLESSITFTSNTGQDVLLHFGLSKDKEEATLYHHSDHPHQRGSMVHIREFLKLKPVEELSDDEEKCDQCGKQFSLEEDRISHTALCPGPSDDKLSTNYICDSCGKLFKRKEHLFQHKKLHTGERPFACDCCGKTFSRKEHLVRHSVSHTGQKQYSCDLCGKSFGRKDNVRKHRKTHGLSGPFVCEICGKQFVVKPYYLMHKASHNPTADSAETDASRVEPGSEDGGGGEERPYRCDVCQRCFRAKHHLSAHRAQHRPKRLGAPATAPEQTEPSDGFKRINTD